LALDAQSRSCRCLTRRFLGLAAKSTPPITRQAPRLPVHECSQSLTRRKQISLISSGERLTLLKQTWLISWGQNRIRLINPEQT